MNFLKGAAVIVSVLVLFLAGAFFVNGDLTFLKPFIPDEIYNTFDLPLLFFLGIITTGVIIAFKGVNVYE